MLSAKPARRTAFWAALALCLCAGALRAADLALFTDAQTGFATAGPALARCAVLAVVLAILWWLGRGAAERPAALAAPARLLAAGLLFTALQAVPLYSTVGLVPALLTAVGLAALAWRAATLQKPAPVVLPALAAMAVPGWLAVRRALISPASVERLPETLRVLSAVAALAFIAALLRALYVPAQPAGRGLFRAGAACFLLCTCIELPQALYEAAHSTARAGALATALMLGLLGLCGLIAAWHAAGPGQRGR